MKSVRPDFQIFNEDIFKTRQEFEKILELPVDSAEYQAKISKFEKTVENAFDPNMLIGYK